MVKEMIFSAACIAAMMAGAGVREDFANPPPETRIQAWYHLTTTGMSEECLAADMKAMGELGVGMAHVFMTNQQVLPPDVKPLTGKWWKLWEVAIREAKKNGIQLGFHNCPGWTSSGGRWIRPKDSMKFLVASAADVDDLAKSVKIATPASRLGFYIDVAVYAFPVDSPPPPQVKANGPVPAAFGYIAPADPAVRGLKREEILDISKYLKAGGVVEVPGDVVPKLPSGHRWRILRVGYTTTGRGCAPAPREVRGLECDKLTKKGLDAHWPHMPHKMINAPGAKGTVAVAMIDSWEVYGQNWTKDFQSEFKRRRGYSIQPWLPVMFGYTVGTAGETAKVRFDLQRTVSDLIAENYFDYFVELCHREGVLAAAESYGGPFDSLHAFKSIDIPTGEFWTNHRMHPSPRLAASAGHLHGRCRIAAEAFTTWPKDGRWQVTPHELRVNGDRGWLEGISQLVFHSYVQQPHDNVKPGFSLLKHGTHLNRHTTWWPEGKWWAQYVRRGQAILQSGSPKADVLVLSGDGSPRAPAFQPDLVAAGYNYDFCGTHDLRRLEVRDGGVAVPGCLPYDVLCLGGDRYLTCATLRKVKELLDAGARVSGMRPEDTPTLSDDPAEWKRLVEAIWGGEYANLRECASALEAVRAFGLRAPADSGGALKAIRRVIEGRDFYFVVAGKEKPFCGGVSFKGEGRPERWDAKTGKISPLPWLADEKGRVKAMIELRPEESMFVSFREPAPGERQEGDIGTAGVRQQVMQDISDNWTVTSFNGKNPPVAPLAFPKLTGWNESADEKLRYFAGRAVYERKVDLRKISESCELDLGDVREIANVWVDGTFLGCVWEAPYRVELPKSVRGKEVTLRVEVINTWPNRLIGDAIARKNGAAEPKGRYGVPKWVSDDKPDSGTGIYTWTSWLGGWTAEDVPRPAGLLGPIRFVVHKPAAVPELTP